MSLQYEAANPFDFIFDLPLELQKENLLSFREKLLQICGNQRTIKRLQSLYDFSLGEEILSCIESNIDKSGHFTAFYPFMREAQASKSVTCDFCFETIHAGSTYCSYRPLLENLSTGKRYVLKRTLKISLAYMDFLPRNIHEFEDLDERLSNPFLQEFSSSQLDYYGISQRIGEGLYLQELHNKKKIKK